MTDSSTKQHISVVICGHVDSGKSTTTGHLMYALGGIDKRDVEKMEKLAEDMGKSSFSFAFFLDTQKAERERGITIQCTTKEFFTDNFHYTIIDAPGHRDFLKNMLSGASQADVGVIMVPADGNFITSVQEGNREDNAIQGQTRQHARLLNLLGVKQLIVCINKMDEATAGYSEERYNEIRDEVRRMLESVGWKKSFVHENVPVIPISGWIGDNLVAHSAKMPWWTGVDVKTYDNSKTVHVTTILDALNDLVVVPKRNLLANARGPINGVYKIKGVGDVLTTRIEQGSFKPGDEVVFLPQHTDANPCTGRIFSVEMHHKSVEAGYPGDNVGLNIKGLSIANPKDLTGSVMIKKGDTSIRRVESFTAQVQVLDPPNDLHAGYTPIVCVRTESAPCRIVKINWRMNKDTGRQKVENATLIRAGDFAELEFHPEKPFVVDTFDGCEGLSRIAILEGASAQMLGKVTKVSFDKYVDPTKEAKEPKEADPKAKVATQAKPKATK